MRLSPDAGQGGPAPTTVVPAGPARTIPQHHTRATAGQWPTGTAPDLRWAQARSPTPADTIRRGIPADSTARPTHRLPLFRCKRHMWSHLVRPRHGCQRPRQLRRPSRGGHRASPRAGATGAPGGGGQPRWAPRHATELPAGRHRGPREIERPARPRARRAGAGLRRARTAPRAAPLRPRRAPRPRTSCSSCSPAPTAPRRARRRRMLGGCAPIKLEADGARRALRVAVGLAVWREGSASRRLSPTRAQPRSASG